MTIFSNPADGKGTPNTTVRCVDCGREQRVNFGVCLAVGWPKCWCNGHTMRLEHTDADITADTGRVIRQSMEADRG